jgi:uncharacterized protein (DUF4415 family)
MPTKAKPENTSAQYPVDKPALQALIDAAPEGEDANAEAWGTATVTHGGGVSATLAELRRARGQRGPQKAPRKVATAIRLSPDVINFFKSSGRGWQTRMDDALREYVKAHSPEQYPASANLR